MYRNLLFDWSGTLVDDLPPTLHATNAVLTSHGVPTMDRKEFRQRFRLPYPEFYQEVLPGVEIESLEDTFRSAFRRSPDPVTVLPHAREILAWCRTTEIRCFVLSSMDPGLLAGQAEDFGLTPYFEHIYSGIIDKREHIGHILQDHNLLPKETAFVGDMVHDVATAHHGQVDSVALLTGYDPEERLRQAAPVHLFSHLGHFRQWLHQATG